MELTRFDLEGETAILINNFAKKSWSSDLPPIQIKIGKEEKITRAVSGLHGELKWSREGEWVLVTIPMPASVDSILLK